MKELGTKKNLLVCQKSKVKDWLEHFKKYYSDYNIKDFTKNKYYIITKKYKKATAYD